MADNSKSEYYNTKAVEVNKSNVLIVYQLKIKFQAAMEVVRLTDDELIGQLTFDKSD